MASFSTLLPLPKVDDENHDPRQQRAKPAPDATARRLSLDADLRVFERLDQPRIADLGNLRADRTRRSLSIGNGNRVEKLAIDQVAAKRHLFDFAIGNERL